MAKSAKYVVRNRETGQVVCEGTSHWCAKSLGITYESFLTMSSRSKSGKWRYLVERIYVEEFAQSWDQMRNRLKRELARIPYPCNGCMRRSVCEFQDTYCEKWKAWYMNEYEREAGRIRHGSTGAVSAE